MKYAVDGMRTIVAEQTMQFLMGKQRVLFLTFIPENDLFPTVIVATAMLTKIREKWILCHIIVEDSARRQGVAEQVLLAIESEHGGHFAAGWCTPEGQAFAKKFMANHGPRPWQVENDPVIERMIDRAFARKAVTP